MLNKIFEEIEETFRDASFRWFFIYQWCKRRKYSLVATAQYIFVTKRFDVHLTNLWKFRKLQKFENPFT